MLHCFIINNPFIFEAEIDINYYNLVNLTNHVSQKPILEYGVISQERT